MYNMICDECMHKYSIFWYMTACLPQHLTTLLLGNTDGSSSSASRLCVLTTYSETPIVTKTTVSADLL